MGVQIQGDTGNVIATKGTYSGNVTIGGTLTYEDVTNIDSVGLITARDGIEVGARPGVAASISVDGNMIVSGVTTIGSNLKVGTGVTLSPDGDVFATGVCTATSFSGDGSALTGVGGTDFIHAEQVNVSGIVTATAFVPTTGQLSHRNLIINGAMQVAQRGTSSTSASYQTVDRFALDSSGTDEAPTQSQVDVASGTTPYTLGFRKAFKITNGNQTSGVGGADFIAYRQTIEAQNVATSGWNYNSTSSSVTLSFWIKSSVAQSFKFTFRTEDGTNYIYHMDTGSLSADTWTKVTKTIPGNSNLQIDNDNGNGIQIYIVAYSGTDYTDNSVTEDAWQTYSTGILFGKDNTSTWYTTNDATLEITGMQLEVGPVATPFEHRSFGDELRRCQRYCFRLGGGTDTESGTTLAMGVQSHSTTCKSHIQFPVMMRSKDITFTFSDLSLDDDVAGYSAGRITGVQAEISGTTSSSLIFDTASMGTVNVTRVVTDAVGGYIQGDCEL